MTPPTTEQLKRAVEEATTKRDYAKGRLRMEGPKHLYVLCGKGRGRGWCRVGETLAMTGASFEWEKKCVAEAIREACAEAYRDGQKAENRRSMRVVNAYLNGKIQMMDLKERMLHRPKPCRERKANA